GLIRHKSTFVSILNACANHVIKDLGKQVHGYITRIKYGTIKNATKVFKGMPLSDLVSWTFLIYHMGINKMPKKPDKNSPFILVLHDIRSINSKIVPTKMRSLQLHLESFELHQEWQQAFQQLISGVS
ncbi:pentatricopeptide repeat-containing protein, partial [Quercus suber]